MDLGAGKTTATQAAAHAGVRLPLKVNVQQLKIIAPPPVTVGGCTLPGPPVVVTVGPFQFNILDWQKAGKAQKKEMSFRGTIDAGVYQYLANMYADVSKKNFQGMIQKIRLSHSTGGGAGALNAITLPSYATGPLASIISGGNVLKIGNRSFSKDYKGWNSGWDLPYQGKDKLTFINSIKPETFWVSRDLLDGKIPLAKVNPPFEDSGHKWGMFVDWTNRQVAGKDEVIVTLKRLERNWLEDIAYEVAHAVEVGLEYLCKAITWDKLQEVRNFGTMFPNATVQSSVLAWQGVAQACGTNVPAQASGPPACIPQEPAPGLAIPWWKQYQGWLIAAGIAVVGVGGLAYYRSRSAP